MVVEVSFLKNVKNSKITNLKNNDAKMKQTNKPTIGVAKQARAREEVGPEKRYCRSHKKRLIIKFWLLTFMSSIIAFERLARTGPSTIECSTSSNLVY